MPWVVYDPDDGTYLCQEEHGKGAPDDLSDGLWQKDVTKATGFDTFAAAASAFAEIDVEEWLPNIKPVWVERAPPASVRRPWNELTFKEKMEQIEEDFNESHARRVQRRMLDTESESEAYLGGAFVDDRPATVQAWSATGRLASSTPARQYIPRPKFVDYVGQLTPPPTKEEAATYDKLLRELAKVPLKMLTASPPVAHVAKPLRRPLSEKDIIDADYASIEMRIMTQIVADQTRIYHGRKEEEGFYAIHSLHSLIVRPSCSGSAPRRELPDDQDDSGSGKRDGGSSGREG